MPFGSNCCGGFATALFNSGKALVNDFLDKNDVVFDLDLGLDFKLGAGASFESKNFKADANAELLNVELVDLSVDMTDTSTADVDFIGKDGEVEISQTAELSTSVDNFKVTALEFESSFTVTAPDYNDSNHVSNFSYLSAGSIDGPQGENGTPELNKEVTVGENTTVRNEMSSATTTEARLNLEGDASTVQFNVKGGALLNFNVGVNIGFKKKNP